MCMCSCTPASGDSAVCSPLFHARPLPARQSLSLPAWRTERAAYVLSVSMWAKGGQQDGAHLVRLFAAATILRSLSSSLNLLSILSNSKLVELKNGETYNGTLVTVDAWMNVHLTDCICTSKVRERVKRAESSGGGVRLVLFQPHHFSLSILHAHSFFLSLLSSPQDGDRFWRLPEAYVRGNTLKYVRVPEPVMAAALEESRRREASGGGYGGRGGRGGRGDGRGGGRGRGEGGGRGRGEGRGRGPPPPAGE